MSHLSEPQETKVGIRSELRDTDNLIDELSKELEVLISTLSPVLHRVDRDNGSADVKSLRSSTSLVREHIENMNEKLVDRIKLVRSIIQDVDL